MLYDHRTVTKLPPRISINQDAWLHVPAWCGACGAVHARGAGEGPPRTTNDRGDGAPVRACAYAVKWDCYMGSYSRSDSANVQDVMAAAVVELVRRPAMAVGVQLSGALLGRPWPSVQ